MDADPRVKDAKRVLRCLAAHPELNHFTRRDLYVHLHRYFKAPELLDGPLRLLAEHRYLRPFTRDRGGKPGPNPERYEVNPLWDRQRASQDPQDPQDQDAEGGTCGSRESCDASGGGGENPAPQSGDGAHPKSPWTVKATSGLAGMK
jgi:hypothetical protein